MRKLVTVFLLLLLMSFFNAFGQEAKSTYFFNGFDLSMNRTNLSNDNTEDRLGLGLGIFRIMRDRQKLNVIVGLEYNLTNQFKKQIYEGHFAQSADVKYAIHNLSVPLNLRYNIGDKVKFFLQSGAFVDFIVSSSKKGIMKLYNPNNTYEEFSFKERAKLGSFNYGFSVGVGVRIPISNSEIIIKTDYKLGLNNLSVANDIYNRYYRLSVGLKL